LEVQVRTAASLVVIVCHGWAGEGCVVMIRLAPTRRQTGAGCSPVRAVMTAGAGEQPEAPGAGVVGDVEAAPGRAVPAVAADPAEPELSCAAELEPAAAQEASSSTIPPRNSALMPNGSDGVPFMGASAVRARVFGDRRGGRVLWLDAAGVGGVPSTGRRGRVSGGDRR
jgi:hypothetical protein